MELTGRVTRDAVIKTMNDEKEVVNFSIAINEYHKPKGAKEAKQITLYVGCNYWQNTAVAKRLVKGAVVEVEGILRIRVYVSKDGETKAAANLRCRHLKVFGVTAKREASEQREESEEPPAAKDKIETIAAITEPMEDVPF